MYMVQTQQIVYQTIIEQWKKFYLFIVDSHLGDYPYMHY